MPRIQIHERGNEVEAKRGRESYNDNPRACRGEKRLEEFVCAITQVDVCGMFICEGPNHQVKGQDDEVKLNDAKNPERNDI